MIFTTIVLESMLTIRRRFCARRMATVAMKTHNQKSDFYVRAHSTTEYTHIDM